MDGEPRITTFLIALLIIGFVTMSFSYFISDGNLKYSSNINNTQVETFNKIDNLKSNIELYKNESEIKENPNALDIIGSYMKGGMKLISLSFGSVDIANSMIDDASQFVDIPQISIFKNTIKLILVVLLIFGVLVAAIMKWRT